MTDKIMVGKLSGCRVCDVIPDHYEYLVWANKQGLLHFTKIVVETISEHAGYKDQQRFIEEEIKPYLEDELIRRERKRINNILDELDEDIPF